MALPDPTVVGQVSWLYPRPGCLSPCLASYSYPGMDEPMVVFSAISASIRLCRPGGRYAPRALQSFTRDSGERTQGDCAVDAVLGTQIYLRFLWGTLLGPWMDSCHTLCQHAVMELRTHRFAHLRPFTYPHDMMDTELAAEERYLLARSNDVVVWDG